MMLHSMLNNDVSSVDSEESMHEPRGGESVLWMLAHRAAQNYGDNNPYAQILRNHMVPALNVDTQATAPLSPVKLR